MLNFQKPLEWVYKTFKADTSKMLIVTGALGWVLSSAAQIAAVVVNNKISPEKKSFLIPQEIMDAVVNIGSFMCFTMLAKKCINKMASTGKIAPKSVREFLDKNQSLYKDKIGKLDFNLDDVLSKNPANAEVYQSYKSYNNFVTTLGTIGASVLSCNIITPLLRNKTASRVQHSYMDYQKNPALYQRPAGNMRV